MFQRQLTMCGPPRAVFNHQLTTFGDHALYSVIGAPLHGHSRGLHEFSPIHRPQSSVAAIIGLFECAPEAMFVVLVHSSSIRRAGS